MFFVDLKDFSEQGIRATGTYSGDLGSENLARYLVTLGHGLEEDGVIFPALFACGKNSWQKTSSK